MYGKIIQFQVLPETDDLRESIFILTDDGYLLESIGGGKWEPIRAPTIQGEDE